MFTIVPSRINEFLKTTVFDARDQCRGKCAETGADQLGNLCRGWFSGALILRESNYYRSGAATILVGPRPAPPRSRRGENSNKRNADERNKTKGRDTKGNNKTYLHGRTTSIARPGRLDNSLDPLNLLFHSPVID